MHDGMPFGRNQGQGQGHSREVDRQSPTGLIFSFIFTFSSTKISYALVSVLCYQNTTAGNIALSHVSCLSVVNAL